MDPKFTSQNPIVEAASRIRARRHIGAAIDAATATGDNLERAPEDAEASLRAFAQSLIAGSKRLNAIVGNERGAKLILLERPLRLRLRFREHRVALDLDEANQLVHVSGLDLDGDYQFDLHAAVPSLFNLSKISTEEGYGEPLTPSSLLKRIAQDAELPHP